MLGEERMSAKAVVLVYQVAREGFGQEDIRVGELKLCQQPEVGLKQIIKLSAYRVASLGRAQGDVRLAALRCSDAINLVMFHCLERGGD